MRSLRLWFMVSLVLAGSLFATAQNDVNLDQGLKPYGSYMGGNIDTVSLTNGNLMLHIPLVSYPQRGGRLTLAFYLRYNNKGGQSFDGIGIDVQRDQLNETRTHTRTFPVPTDNGTAHVVVRTTSMTTADGSSHDLGWQSGAKGVTAGPVDGSALGQHGIKHFVDGTTSIPVDPSCTNAGTSFWNPVISQDPNGNQIVTSSLGWTDTMGRVIPGQAVCPAPFSNGNTDRGIFAGTGTGDIAVRMLPGANTSDFSGCPTNTVMARIWALPAFANSSSPSSAATATMKFCYAHFISTAFTLLQNVILPNGTMWSFNYNGSGDLSDITFPTGGTIHYEWTSLQFCAGPNSRTLISRTVTDDTGPHTWNYAWTPGVLTNINIPPPPTTVLVTDPAQNQSLHVSSSMGGCSYYETHAEFYQGSLQSGALLKKVDRQYNTFTLPSSEYVGSAAYAAAFPTIVTTTWANGMVNQEKTDYDSPTTYTNWDFLCYNCANAPQPSTQTRINGQVAADSVFDYGNGAAGPLLRKTAITYLTLDDPSSVITYDGAGHKCAQTDYAYDDSSRLVPSNISQSHTTPYTGAVRANPSSVTRWLSTTPCASNATWSPITTYTNYFDTGELASATDALNNITQFSYAPIFYGAYLTQTKLPDTVTNGSTYSHIINGDYDFNTGLLRTFTDQNNNSSTYFFDNMRRIANANFADGGQVQFNYPDVHTVEKKQLQNSQTAVWIDQVVTFDGFGREKGTQLKHPGGDIFTATTYDSLGHIASVSNPYRSTASSTDGTTTTQFDALGRPTQITKQDQSFSTVSYAGSCVTTTDEAGKAHRACSDGAGRLTEVDEPGDANAPASSIPASSATVTIGGPGEQSVSTSGGMYCAVYTVDGTCADWEMNPPNTTYDFGTVYVTANSHTNQASYGPNDTYQTISTALANAINGDPAASVNASVSGATITLTPRSSSVSPYFSLVCPTTSWDSADFSSPSFTTGCAAAAPVFGGHAYVTLYNYDPLGNVLCVEQHGNVSGTGCSAPPSSDASSPWRVRRFTYDSLSRLLTATKPESGQMTYQYNASGDLISKTDARGVIVNYSPSDLPIDPLHRVQKKTYTNSNDPAVTYIYDQALNGIGRLAATSNGSASVAYAYDQRGRVKTQSYCFPSTCTESFSINAAYDQAGNMISLTYPSGRGIGYGYNSANLLNTVQFAQWNGAAPPYGIYTYSNVANTDFLPSGLPAKATLGNGMTANQAQNNRLQLSAESTVGTGNLLFESRTYSYGTQNNGNVLSITDQLNSGRTQAFTYDALNRLATANESRWGLGFVYDPWGNRLQQNLTAGTAGQSQLLVSGKNQVIGYNFDPAGNMLNDGVHQYAYDGENHIKTVDTTAATYTYGPGGERIRKDTGGTSTEYLYFNGSAIAEKDVTSGTWSDYVFAGDKRIARATNFEHQLHISGQICSNCGWQWYQFNFTNLNGLAGRVIQSGDALRWIQWSSGGSKGGIIITYTDGTDSCCSSAPVLNDQNGENIGSGSLSTNQWEYRIASLSPVAGKAISQIRVYANGVSTPPQWDIYFQDLVFTGADGTVVPLFSQNATVPSLSGFGSTGMTQTSATINNCVGSGCAPINTTTYYHGDQIGSSRLLTNGTGYAIWQGTFLPFGEEYSRQLTTNHYKFTDKERDDESGLDYFAARYYGSALGRFLTPDFEDPMLAPDPMPWSDLDSPQSLNLYSYVRNNPTSLDDPDGHDCVVQSRTGSHSETVTVTPGSCDNVKVGDGQRKDYVPGTVDPSSIKDDGHGGITFSFKPYDGSSAGVGYKPWAPIPDNINLAFNWGNNAQGYRTLSRASTVVNEIAVLTMIVSGGNLIMIAGSGGGLTTLGDLSITPTAGEEAYAQNVLAQGGKKAVAKAIKTLSKRLAEHEAKLKNLKGDPGSVEREIAGFVRTIKALSDLLK